MDDEIRQFHEYTKETGLGWEASTRHLVMTVFKAVRLKKPSYLAEKFKLRQPNESEVFPHRQTNCIKGKANLTISRGGIVYRGAKLWNLMDPDLRNEPKLKSFKPKVKIWIIANVPIKPP